MIRKLENWKPTRGDCVYFWISYMDIHMLAVYYMERHFKSASHYHDLSDIFINSFHLHNNTVISSHSVRLWILISLIRKICNGHFVQWTKTQWFTHFHHLNDEINANRFLHYMALYTNQIRKSSVSQRPWRCSFVRLRFQLFGSLAFLIMFLFSNDALLYCRMLWRLFWYFSK